MITEKTQSGKTIKIYSLDDMYREVEKDESIMFVRPGEVTKYVYLSFRNNRGIFAIEPYTLYGDELRAIYKSLRSDDKEGIKENIKEILEKIKDEFLDELNHEISLYSIQSGAISNFLYDSLEKFLEEDLERFIGKKVERIYLGPLGHGSRRLYAHETKEWVGEKIKVKSKVVGIFSGLFKPIYLDDFGVTYSPIGVVALDKDKLIRKIPSYSSVAKEEEFVLDLIRTLENIGEIVPTRGITKKEIDRLIDIKNIPYPSPVPIQTLESVDKSWNGWKIISGSARYVLLGGKTYEVTPMLSLEEVRNSELVLLQRYFEGEKGEKALILERFLKVKKDKDRASFYIDLPNERRMLVVKGPVEEVKKVGEEKIWVEVKYDLEQRLYYKTFSREPAFDSETKEYFKYNEEGVDSFILDKGSGVVVKESEDINKSKLEEGKEKLERTISDLLYSSKLVKVGEGNYRLYPNYDFYKQKLTYQRSTPSGFYSLLALQQIVRDENPERNTLTIYNISSDEIGKNKVVYFSCYLDHLEEEKKTLNKLAKEYARKLKRGFEEVYVNFIRDYLRKFATIEVSLREVSKSIKSSRTRFYKNLEEAFEIEGIVKKRSRIKNLAKEHSTLCFESEDGRVLSQVLLESDIARKEVSGFLYSPDKRDISGSIFVSSLGFPVPLCGLLTEEIIPIPETTSKEKKEEMAREISEKLAGLGLDVDAFMYVFFEESGKSKKDRELQLIVITRYNINKVRLHLNDGTEVLIRKERNIRRGPEIHFQVLSLEEIVKELSKVPKTIGLEKAIRVVE